MTRRKRQCTDAFVLREVDLGAHHLLLMSDQRIELMCCEEAPQVTEHVLSLDCCEAYCLMLSLQEMFQAIRTE